MNPQLLAEEITAAVQTLVPLAPKTQLRKIVEETIAAHRGSRIAAAPKRKLSMTVVPG